MQPLSTISTIHGKTYENCRILQKDPDGVYIAHSLGLAKILYVDLNENDRGGLGYDAEKAAAYEKGLAEKRDKRRQQAFEYRKEVIKAQAAAAQVDLMQLQMAASGDSGYATMAAYDAGLPLLASWGTGNPFFPFNYGPTYGRANQYRRGISPYADAYVRAHRGYSTVLPSGNSCQTTTGIINVYGNPVRPTRNTKVPFATPALSGSVPALAPAARVTAPRPAISRVNVSVGGGGAHK